MKIGIISDTHGQVDLALSAAREFIFRGIEAVFHCGDIGSDMVLIEMASLFQALDIPLYAVLGNCDQHLDFQFIPRNLGVEMLGRFGEVDVAGRRIAFLHSDDEPHFNRVVDSKQYDYVFFGHSHARRDERIEKTRLVNPGAAGRGMHPSCAVLDLVEDAVTFFSIRRSE
ncbi:MAG: metallophosphoesterase family protein [Verrucomicrobia bacterium]|nr:metallophosphoesterase family protein [Verrucomicrobiota bacterium]